MNSLNRFIAQLKKIALTKEERAADRRQLLAFMEMKPIRKELMARQETMAPSRIPQKSIIMQFFLKPMPIALAAMLLIGGVARGAQNALPGDPLYPIKIAGESIHATLTFDAASQANLEIKLAVERLDEAEKLASKGTLNAKARAKIEANFDEHAERVKTRIAEFEAKEKFDAATDVAAKFQNSIDVHARVLENLDLKNAAVPVTDRNETPSEAASIARKARLKAGEIRTRSGDIKEKETTKENADAEEEDKNKDAVNEVKTETKIIPPVTKIEKMISWSEAVSLIRACKVATLSQKHSKEVELILKDGTTHETQEPAIDAVIAEATAAVPTCGTFPITTE